MPFMKTGLPCLGLIFLLAMVSPEPLHSQPAAVPQGTTCVECGMKVDESSRFAGQVTTGDNKTLFFCDIGDMLLHLKRHRLTVRGVYVKDHDTGEWIEGAKAFYVSNKDLKTPMSWGIAAFGREASARRWGSPVDFDNASRLLR